MNLLIYVLGLAATLQHYTDAVFSSQVLNA